MEKSAGVKVTKRKRVSKKTKKSWRKHADIADVERYLDDQRLQERTGGLVAEKSNVELFFVDKNTDSTPVDQVTAAGRRRQPKPLRCHAALLPDPRIPPARVDRGEAQLSTQKSRRSKKVIQASSTTTVSSAKPVAELHQRKRKKKWAPTYDLWGSCDVSETPADADEHYLTVCKKKRVKPPGYYHKKPSELPAIEVPHPGTSYRPAPEDHQELVQKALEVEQKKLREEQRIKRALDNKFPKACDAPDENTWLQEWLGTGSNEDDSDREDLAPAAATGSDGTLSSEVSHNPPVRRENKKTERQRKKQKLAKLKEREAAKEKNKKLHQRGIFRLKSVKKEVMQREMALAARDTRRQREKEKTDGVATRRLGRVKYEEPTIELKLSSEQVGSLRLLEPEGSLLRDHFNSLQKRNIIEPRQRAKIVYKTKPKVFEKKGHKAVTA